MSGLDITVGVNKSFFTEARIKTAKGWQAEHEAIFADEPLVLDSVEKRQDGGLGIILRSPDESLYLSIELPLSFLFYELVKHGSGEMIVAEYSRLLREGQALAAAFSKAEKRRNRVK